MAADLAAHANATAAGYARTQTDRGASFGVNRFISVYEKPVVGVQGSGGVLRATGISGVSQAAADTAALAALNAQRGHRYGKGSANTGKNVAGDSLTDDLH